MEEHDGPSILKADLADLILPNSMFINGISLFLNDTSSCDEKDFETCSDNDVECETGTFVPDPTQYNLPDDYIYVELEWGSLFYKHIGRRTKSEAKVLCSKDGAHLPTPRFKEENEFYKTHFGDDGLWLDVTYDAKKGLKTANGHWYIKYIQSFTETDNEPGHSAELMNGDIKLAMIIYDEWINFNNKWPGMFNAWTERDVFMTNSGVWDSASEEKKVCTEVCEEKEIFWECDDVCVNEGDIFNAVCVYNILPDENCSQCQNESVCKFNERAENEIECVCQKMTKGEFCEIDLCSDCKNGGYCEETEDGTQCICPYPFYGEYCEGKRLLLRKTDTAIEAKFSLPSRSVRENFI